MAPLPPDAIPKVQQLIRLMASDQDGEALGAVRAMARLLKSKGNDFHDLAGAISAMPAQERAIDSPFAWDAAGYEPDYYEPTPRGACPTWSSLRGFERKDWASVVVKKFETRAADDRQAMIKLRFKIINAPDRALTHQEQRLFDRMVRLAWTAGLRP